MVEFLAGVGPEVLNDAHILEASVLLQVLDALGTELQILLDLAVVGVPELAIMACVLDDDFVGSDRLHSVVQAVTGSSGVASDFVNGTGMHNCAGGPRVTVGIEAMT